MNATSAIKAIRWALVAWYAVLWAGGVVSYAVPALREAQPSWAGPLFLLTGSLLVLSTCPARALPRLVAAAVLGWGIEVLGVHTGFPFGDYTYTTVLGPGAFGVPFVMVSAWLILLAWARSLTAPRGLSPWAVYGLGALWLVGIDLVIDPLAGGALGHWTWVHPGAYHGIPLTNFAGWFGSAFVLLAVAGRPACPEAWHLGVGASVVAFFTVLAAEQGLALPAAVGAGLMALQTAMWIRATRRARGSTGPEAPPSPPR